MSAPCPEVPRPRRAGAAGVLGRRRQPLDAPARGRVPRPSPRALEPVRHRVLGALQLLRHAGDARGARRQPPSSPHLSEKEAYEQAALTYGGYTAMVYMTGILGGLIADRILGYRRAILLGGVLMAIGLFMLMAPDLTTFLFGLAFIVVGNGLFKPNISTMVGQLYAPADPRRDAGFTIFYMGINAGAFLAPIVCASVVGQLYGYRWGFFTAAVGMLLGLMMLRAAQGLARQRRCAAARPPPARIADLAATTLGMGALVLPVYFLLGNARLLGGLLLALMAGLVLWFVWSGARAGRMQLHRYLAMLILFVANVLFWSLFEQAGSSLNFLARDHVRMPEVTVLGWQPTFEAFQAVNPIFIILLAPVFATLWVRLDRAGWNPSIPRKFALGLAGAALGFYVLVLAASHFPGEDGRIGWEWLTLAYLLHTMGELCLSPIGLAMVTKLAKPEETGLAMGGWFLSIAMANFLAGQIAAYTVGGVGEEAASLAQYGEAFLNLAIAGGAAALLFLLAAPLINRLMHGVR
ncbi:MAG: peptide MFS transporter [Xanthomonadales bacterium]|nr:peptide MFS transporter [Xanthomonadales bacterium]